MILIFSICGAGTSEFSIQPPCRCLIIRGGHDEEAAAHNTSLLAILQSLSHRSTNDKENK